MFMDFAMLPPEVNSTRMYSGPGAGSLWAAAAAWDQVSAELQSAAETYRSVIASLTGWQWLGPSSVRMGAAVTPYVEWLTTTAAQARQTATQITAAATGFEQAFAMTVPPPAIMANRAQVLSLIATNFFGQNTAAIAALETQYAEMWEQDATAMYDYAATSAAARTLTPFTSPQQDTNSAGLPAQSAEVSRATANAGAADGNWLGNLLEEIGILLLPIAPELTPFFLEAGEIVNAIPFPSIVGDEFCLLDGLLAWYAMIGSINNINSMGTGIIGAEKNLGILPELGSAAAAAAPPPADIAPAFLAPLTSMAKSLSDEHYAPASSGRVGTAGRRRCRIATRRRRRCRRPRRARRRPRTHRCRSARRHHRCRRPSPRSCWCRRCHRCRTATRRARRLVPARRWRHHRSAGAQKSARSER